MKIKILLEIQKILILPSFLWDSDEKRTNLLECAWWINFIIQKQNEIRKRSVRSFWWARKTDNHRQPLRQTILFDQCPKRSYILFPWIGRNFRVVGFVDLFPFIQCEEHLRNLCRLAQMYKHRHRVRYL